MNDALKVLCERRSIRKYRDAQISREELDTLDWTAADEALLKWL